MRSISLSILFWLLFLGCSNQYGDIETHTVVSTTNGISYKIVVLKPYSYDSAKSYPIIYLLDGQYLFDSVSDIVADLHDDNKINDVIVVGIGYTSGDNRTYDYLYPTATVEFPAPTGGGELFHTFMRDELIPFIEARYSANISKRTIMGHSAGGYFGLYSLFHHYIIGDTPFTNFIAISPSIWWADSYLLGEEIATNAATNDLNVSIYLSYGTLEGSIMSAPLLAMQSQIASSGYNNISIKINSFEQGHMSVVSPSVYDSFPYFFGN